MEQLALLKNRLDELLKAYKRLQETEATNSKALEAEKLRSAKLMTQLQACNRELLAAQLQAGNLSAEGHQEIYTKLQHTLAAINKVLSDLEY